MTVLPPPTRQSPQIAVDDAAGHQHLDMADALIARAFEFLQRQAGGAIGLVKLLGPAACIPFRAESRQRGLNLGETHTIGARIGPGIGREFQPAAGHDIGDDLREIANAVIVIAVPDIERLARHGLGGGLHCGQKGAGNILDMHDRAPGRAVRLQIDQPLRHCPGDKIVQHDVEAHARRDAVSRRGPQEHRTEAVAGERGDIALRPDFRLAIRRHRVERAGLVDHLLAGFAVIRAGRRHYEARHARLLRHPCQMDAAAVIDAEGDVRIDVAQGIVRQRREVDDGVDARQIGARHVANVLPEHGHIGNPAAGLIGAALVKVAVAADDLVARLQEHRHHHRSDIAKMAGHQDFHRQAPLE